MSEKVVNQEEQKEQATEQKKPVAKAKVTAKAEEQKPGIFKRFGLWCKKHKEALITGGVSFVAGAAATVGTGMVLDRRNARRNAPAPTVQPEYQEPMVNDLDPNL